MTTDTQRWQRVVLGVDGARRVGWAKYYTEALYARQLESLVDCYGDALVPEMLALTHAVLYERNAVAFARAYKVQCLIWEYMRRHPERDTA